MADDEFALWLGRIGIDPGFRGAVRRVVNLAGGLRRGGTGSRFTGARAGRGSAAGGLLRATGGQGGRRARRVVVKARIARLGGKGLKAAAAHLRYLQRDGTTREGERGVLYGPEGDVADGKAFLERGTGDRHQFRFILSAEDGAEYADLRPLVRRWMTQVEQDLGTRLDWVATDHFDTGHPHSHVLVRGKDASGKDLVIARDYLTNGLRERAGELVNLDLGPRSDREIAAADRREVAQERLTGIDRRLIRATGADGIVSAVHPDRREQSLRTGRLGTLARMGLATRVGRGQWRLDDMLEATLRAMGRRGDIIATLDHAARARQVEIAPTDYAVYDPADRGALPVVGRVVDRGLAEHDEDRAYLIVDGIDGRAHYVDLGAGAERGEGIGREAVVRITPVPAAAREVDRTVAAIAESNGGYYSPELHALHDPSTSARYIAAHVRRLEALRRLAGAAERAPDGLWHIAPDHLDRAQAYEVAKARERPVDVQVIANRPLEQLVRHDGITALEEDPDLADAARHGGGFGRRVSDALVRRRQWLAEQGLGEGPETIEVLRRRELARVASVLSRQLGLDLVETGEGSHIRGTYRQSVQVGALRMAVIDDGRGFALVPWRPALDRQLGREVSGVMRGRDVNWSFGRQRAGPER